jgi:alpha-glucosidase
VYNFIPGLVPYTNVVDLTFNFSLIDVEPTAHAIRAALLEAEGVEGLAWSMSNHDISRLATRWGPNLARVAAMLLLSVPGAALIYQGDEIGMTDGSGASPAYDRVGRDAFRHPMQWTPNGGFTTGTPWLPMTNAESVNVASQENDPNSSLNFYRKLLEVRRDLDEPLQLEEPQGDVLVLRRQAHIIVLNFGNTDTVGPQVQKLLVSTHPGSSPALLRAHSGYIGSL